MNKKVLILEDNDNSRTMLRQLLHQIDAGLKVVEAKNLQEAYFAAMEETMDLFLLDIMIDNKCPGDTSGIRFAEKMRRIARYRFTPIIFITLVEDQELYAFRNIHSYGYIEKPYDTAETKRLISEALQYALPEYEERSVYFRKDGILYAVRIRDILFAESRQHILYVHKRQECLEIPYKTCKQFLQEVDSPSFLQCSRNTVINKKYIRYVDIPNRYIAMEHYEGLVEIGITFVKKIAKDLNL